ncbi:hypothetical protein [Lusitaniella coriacea]|uniref:hypothetical protein n=1 Tax=Lusitaniella coriacea TaxID=1983105 RepID=UPI003CEBA163
MAAFTDMEASDLRPQAAKTTRSDCFPCDRINALLAGCGFNLRKLFRFFFSSEAPA